MDNLQKHYLQRLAYAQKMALEGYSGTCMNICLDLRMEPDLAMYTRALVCLTLSEFVSDHSTKIVLTEEAERIAKELQENKQHGADEAWEEEYRLVETNATTLRSIFQAELNAQEATPSDRSLASSSARQKSSDLELSHDGGRNDGKNKEDSDGAEMEMDDDDDGDRKSVQISGTNRAWSVEGAFTLNPGIAGGQAGRPSVDVVEADDRTSKTEKKLPQRVKALAGLPTPPGSSQPTSESP